MPNFTPLQVMQTTLCSTALLVVNNISTYIETCNGARTKNPNDKKRIYNLEERTAVFGEAVLDFELRNKRKFCHCHGLAMI